MFSPLLRPAAALLLASAILSPLPAPLLAQDGPHPKALEQAGVPKGTLLQMPPWESTVFAGTTRDWWVYVPAQYRPDKPAALMVFQDGHDYIKPQGNWRAPVVFDNLIAAGLMPVTLAVFINPGHAKDLPPAKNPWQSSNRSFEYDSLGDRYAQFLLSEILPELEKTYRLSNDPKDRALCGESSGGACAFTAAWERPESFGKVLSTIGSFTNLRGAHHYPAWIRKTDRKPIRVYLEDSSGDLDNPFGNWPLANQQMAAALRYMGYDTRLDYAEGYGHNSKHGGPLFPEALQWLWRTEDFKPAQENPDLKKPLGGDMPLQRLLIEGEPWRLVADNLVFTDGPCSDAAGNFYFSDLKAPAILKVSPEGAVSKIRELGASGLKFGPDHRLYACQPAEKRVVAIPLDGGPVEVLASDVQPNDLAVSHRGHVYFTETGKKQVSWIDATTRQLRAADVGITGPNGITLSPDQTTLAVSDYKGQHVWVFRVEPDGSLSAKAPYMTLRTELDNSDPRPAQHDPVFKTASGGDGMTCDLQGRYYVASKVGIQVFDPTGRLCGVVSRPQPQKPLPSCALSGPGLQYLYATQGDKVFLRKVQAEACLPHLGPTPVVGR
jgi:enterochelin esterase family protein